MAQPAEAEAAAERAVLQQQQQRAGQEVEPPAFNVARSAIDKAGRCTRQEPCLKTLNALCRRPAITQHCSLSK